MSDTVALPARKGMWLRDLVLFRRNARELAIVRDKLALVLDAATRGRLSRPEHRLDKMLEAVDAAFDDAEAIGYRDGWHRLETPQDRAA